MALSFLATHQSRGRLVFIFHYQSRYDRKVSTPPQTPIDPIQSDQQHIHADLATVVRRHVDRPWERPVPGHTRMAFEEAMAWWQGRPTSPLILDSFCGTGMSTALLAKQYPNATVIGVDKSQHRLAKHQVTGSNYRLFRADCEGFWQCLTANNITLSQHWLLYPNPWPKSGHLKRRVHGHPGFPLLKALGGRIELRTNWHIYAQEFAQACHHIGIDGQLSRFSADSPMTRFEDKYQHRGHALWRFVGES